jgi:hypothetical protein
MSGMERGLRISRESPLKIQNFIVAVRIALLAVVSACSIAAASEPAADIDAVFAQAAQAPASFVASYPPGSQKRREQDVANTLLSSHKLVYPMLKAASARDPKLSGKMTYALALGTDGTVEGLALVDNSVADKALTQNVSVAMFNLKFGPAIGTGYYIVYYQFQLNSRT